MKILSTLFSKGLNTLHSSPMLALENPQESQENWLKLFEFGQVLDKNHLYDFNCIAAQSIKSSFHSLIRKILGRWLPIPILSAGMHGSTVSNVWGHVSKVKIEENSFWIYPTWTRPKCLLFKENQNYGIYGNFHVKIDASGLIEPTALHSVFLSHRQRQPLPLKSSVLPQTELVHSQFLPQGLFPLDSSATLLTHVKNHMERNGLNYLESWLEVKQTHPEYFTNIS